MRICLYTEFSSAYPAKFIIEKNIVHTENANKPNGYGAIDALSFSPYPKNPNIAKFFREIGLADELGSGVKNVNHYLKIYSGGTPKFIEADIFKQVIPIAESISTTQDAPQLKNASKLVEFCSIPRSRQEMMDFVGLKDKKNFVKNYINPMIEQGMIEMTNPDKPTSKFEKYATKKG